MAAVMAAEAMARGVAAMAMAAAVMAAVAREAVVMAGPVVALRSGTLGPCIRDTYHSRSPSDGTTGCRGRGHRLGIAAWSPSTFCPCHDKSAGSLCPCDSILLGQKERSNRNTVTR